MKSEDTVNTLKKGRICTGRVKELKFPNKGIVVCIPGENGDDARESEFPEVTVKGVIPGQIIEFIITKKKNGKYEGRLTKVIKRSEIEDAAASGYTECIYGELCGGCAYRTVGYAGQLKLKEQMVKDILDGVCSDYEYEGIEGSPAQAAYRNKMEFTFGDAEKGGKLALGLHKKDSFYDIVTVEGCLIVHEDYSKILSCALKYFTEKKAEHYHRIRHTGDLRHLLVRRAETTEEILVDIVTTSAVDDALPDGLADRLLKLQLKGKIKGILHTINDRPADVIQNDGTRILYGNDYIYEEILGLKFKISVFSFFQTNSRGAEVLYSKVREYAGDTKGMIIYDLYSGTGTIAQMLAPVADRVIGIEIVEEAVLAAIENARLNGLENCEFIAGDVLKELNNVKTLPDLIVLDPPRDGIHPKVLAEIINYGVDRIIYISCKPTSLARDLAVFIDGGYEVKRAAAVDMFPYTGHVETCVLLSKGEIDSQKVRVEFSLEDMDMSGFRQGATYQGIKDYVKKQTGLSVSSLYISQIKRKCGLEVGQNYHLAKSDDTKVPKCPPEKEKAIREALEYFGMA